MSKYVKIGAIWEDEETGYLGGNLEGKVYLFGNKSEHPKSPKYDMCVKVFEKKEEEDF